MTQETNTPPPDETAETARTEREPETERPATNFARQAAEAPPGVVAEFVDFLLHNKKWWLTPIILVLLLVGLLIVFSSTAAPFIYPFF